VKAMPRENVKMRIIKQKIEMRSLYLDLEKGVQLKK